MDPLGVVVSEKEYYFDAEEVPPPRGMTINLLTEWGRACQGPWVDGGGFVGWAPLHRVSPSLKRKMK
jgi:hypothetical protein